MKILVLENNPKELAIIQKALPNDGYILIPLVSSEDLWPYVRSGESHFLIANWDTSDLHRMQFISRVRSMKIADPFFILLTTEMNLDEELAPSGADDIIQRPFRAQDLKNRVVMAERIISLSNSLLTAHDQLESQAVFDPLTGFMNRSGFFRQSNGELERARRASLPLSLIALDIDNFKVINDTFGLEIGDDVLRMTSQAVREKSRPYDCIGRWMGDEFIVMLAGVIGADAEKIAERVIAGVRGTHVTVENKPPVLVKISAGIASAARISASTEVEPLIQQARQAMARAKEAGGNQVFLIYV